MVPVRVAAVQVAPFQVRFRRPVLEWAKVSLVWTARVAYVVDDNATMVVQWLPADVLTPVSG